MYYRRWICVFEMKAAIRRYRVPEQDSRRSTRRRLIAFCPLVFSYLRQEGVSDAKNGTKLLFEKKDTQRADHDAKYCSIFTFTRPPRVTALLTSRTDFIWQP